jgi:uncharacterized iron-regulated membrane protein
MKHVEKELKMAIVLPMVGMVVIGALYTGVYLWMRRASFGESKVPHESSTQ